jgi:hypothetical protein
VCAWKSQPPKQVLAPTHLVTLLDCACSPYPKHCSREPCTCRTCFVGDQTDEGVQLQIIKALLTAVTTPSCDVHEGTLLKVCASAFSFFSFFLSIYLFCSVFECGCCSCGFEGLGLFQE